MPSLGNRTQELGSQKPPRLRRICQTQFTTLYYAGLHAGIEVYTMSAFLPPNTFSIARKVNPLPSITARGNADSLQKPGLLTQCGQRANGTTVCTMKASTSLDGVHSALYEAIVKMVNHKCRDVVDNFYASHIMCIWRSPSASQQWADWQLPVWVGSSWHKYRTCRAYDKVARTVGGERRPVFQFTGRFRGVPAGQKDGSQPGLACLTALKCWPTLLTEDTTEVYGKHCWGKSDSGVLLVSPQYLRSPHRET
jgi:hypothetical protein